MDTMAMDFERDFEGLDFSRDAEGRYIDPHTRYTFKLYPPLWEKLKRQQAQAAQASLF